MEDMNYLRPSISKSQNAMLIAPFTEQKIKNALFSMHPDKSPTPDEMNLASFFFLETMEYGG